jgi:hypothetical protein
MNGQNAEIHTKIRNAEAEIDRLERMVTIIIETAWVILNCARA